MKPTILNRINLKHFLIGALALTPTVGQAAANQCYVLFENQATSTAPNYDRTGDRPEVDLKNVLSILAERKESQAMGVTLSRFSKKFGTRFYFSGTGAVDRNGETPFVDPNSKAVFIFVHGSGTMASSGKNFYGVMNQLAPLGFSSLSFDMPFHMHGPIKDQFKSADYFMNWLNEIVTEVKKSGKPVYMVGHSFGPDVIAEYVTRNPFAIQGGVLLSPAGFNKTLSDWYDQHTSKMNFGGDVQENRLAGEWAGMMSSQFIWNKTNGKNDPTVKNPNLVIRMLSGGREEYVPAPVGGSKKTPIGDNTYDIAAAFKEHFTNAVAQVEPGVGHYIFNHNDREGVNVILREILAVVGLDAKKYAELRHDYGIEKEKINSGTFRAAQLYGSDRIFKKWIDEKISYRAFRSLIDKENDAVLSTLVVKYQEEMTALDEKINQAIIMTETTLPGFYKLNQKGIEELKKLKKKTNTLHAVLLDYLKNEKPEVIQRVLGAGGL